MEKTARIISAIFNPLLIPTYAIILTFTTTILFIVATESKIGVTAVTFAITCLLPLLSIFILYKMKIVSDAGLNKRKERLIPYSIAAVCYFGWALYLHALHSPAWLWAFATGGGVATLICAVINLWWKISAHATAMGGFAAYIFCIMYNQLNIISLDWIFIAAVITAGIVATTRLILERHTFLQLLAGTANGIVCVTAAIMLAY